MGDSKISRVELNELAKATGGAMGEFNARLHSLAMAFDCIVTVLDARFSDDGDKSPISNSVKAELERRKNEAQKRVGPCPACGTHMIDGGAHECKPGGKVYPP